MILSIVVLLIVGVIAFFHYTQGLWSATLSAFSAVLAAVLAVSYHEVVAGKLLAGAMADSSLALSLIGLFAAIYLILRMIFDSMVPGNLRLPPTLDKVGGAIMGAVAGAFSCGIVVLAAQSMSFGPAIAGYARYPIEDSRDVQVQIVGGRAQEDVTVNDELEEQELDPAQRVKLMIPVDDIVIGTVAKLSDGGSLAGARTLESVHPAYIDEMFLSRLGIQTGARRTALNVGGKEQVEVTGVFRIEGELRQTDAELAQVRSRPVTWPSKPPAGKSFLVVRTLFKTGTADDKDDLVRVSPGSVRLVANGVNYTPIGTLQDASMLLANKPDDFLFLKEEQAADFVFIVETADVLSGEGDAKTQPTVNDGVFIEVKRLARVDLSGKPAVAPVKPGPNVEVMRKPAIIKAPPTPPPQPAQPPAPAPAPAPAPTAPAPAAPAAPAPAP